MTPSISARIRCTSASPISWISLAVLAVVVCHFTLYAYIAAPFGSALAAIVSRQAGRYRGGQERVKPLERRGDGLAVRVRRARCQGGAVGFGDGRRPCLERVEHRAARRIVDNLRPDLIGHVAERDARRHHAVGQALLHQRDGLVDERAHRFEASDDVLVVGAGCRRHQRNRVRDVLLNPLELVHRHQQVVRHHPADRHRVVVKVEALRRRLQEFAIEVVTDLVLGAEPGAIDLRNPLNAAPQVRGASVDGRLRIVSPARVLTGVPDGGRRFRVLRHPVLPVLVQRRAEPLRRRRRVGRGTGNDKGRAQSHETEQKLVAHAGGLSHETRTPPHSRYRALVGASCRAVAI